MLRPYRDNLTLVGGFVSCRLLPLHQLNVQAERLQLAHEDVERFGHAGLDARFALDDGLVNLRAAIDVVRLRREQLLQDVRCTIGFQRPDFHFAETLAAELRLAAERLLRNERVRADGARVNLVIDEMRKLEHVDVADGDGLVELLAAHAVKEVDLAGVRQTRDFEQVADFRFARAVENRRGEGNTFAETFGILEQLIVTELRERLPHRGFRKHFPEPAAQRLGLHFLAEQALEAVAQLLGGPAEMRLKNLADVHTRRNTERIENDLDRSAVRHVRHVFLRHDAGDDALVALAPGHLVAEQIREALEALIREDADFVGEVLLQLENLRGFNGLVALVLFSALAGEDLDVHDGALDARRAVERSVANIAGLFAEDGAEQFFFRRERGFALGRNLADKNVTWLHDCADADASGFVEVAKERLADVGNIACDFLGTQLGVARFDFVLLDVNRGVVIVLDQLFADQDGVFEVVAAPG